VSGSTASEDDYDGQRVVDGALRILQARIPDSTYHENDWSRDVLTIRPASPVVIYDVRKAFEKAVEESRKEIAEHIAHDGKEPESAAEVSVATLGKQRSGGRGIADMDANLRVLPNREGFGQPGEYDQP
jgi:hypothetical protein